MDAIMVEDINELLMKLSFSEEKTTRVMSTKKVNREAMYQVFKSLWFTKEEANFVALKEGAILCLFNMVPYVKD
ncbi:hypothetical protein Gotur_003527 [Gossypium turneri]